MAAKSQEYEVQAGSILNLLDEHSNAHAYQPGDRLTLDPDDPVTQGWLAGQTIIEVTE